MEILILLFIIGSIGLIVWSIIISKRSAPLRLPQDSLNIKVPKTGLDFSMILPTRAFLDSIGMSAGIKKNLDAAHLSMTPAGFFNIKVILCIILVIISIIAANRADPVFIIIALALGYIVPDFLLKRKIAKRKYLVARTLPETVDLLGLCIEAGLDFVSSAKWVIEKTPKTPMVEELAFVIEEVKWGKPRVQALKDMSRRLNIPEISSFVQTIIQADRMGTPIAEAFSILSEDSRAQRFHRGERTALQAPIKILLPLIFFIMPVIGIVIGGPILLQFMQGGLSGLK